MELDPNLWKTSARFCNFNWEDCAISSSTPGFISIPQAPIDLKVHANGFAEWTITNKLVILAVNLLLHSLFNHLAIWSFSRLQHKSTRFISARSLLSRRRSPTPPSVTPIATLNMLPLFAVFLGPKSWQQLAACWNDKTWMKTILCPAASVLKWNDMNAYII